MFRHRHRPDSATAAMLAAVASESLPYTDPRAGYPTAVGYRATRGSVATQAKEPYMTGSTWDGDEF